MKLCTRFFEHVYINPRGEVRICAWNNVVIGNLLTDTMEDIWNSDNRKQLLEGLLGGCVLNVERESAFIALIMN